MSFLSSLFGSSPAAARVTGAQARDLVSAGAQLVDVRTPAEFAGGHHPGAVNIPVGALPARLGELDPATPVVVYCRSGGRSANAGSLLVKADFEAVHDLGPMQAW